MRPPGSTQAALPYLIDRPLADHACWIWAPGVAGPNRYVEFTRKMEGGIELTEAWIQLGAETSLRLWVNGALVHAGPGREAPPYFYFDTIDLRPLLRAGGNELRIVAHHQGQDSQSYQAGTPALLVAGHWASNHQTVDLAEAAGWRARRLNRYRADAPRLFSCLGFSEHVDFQAHEGDWEPAVVVAAHPWAERPRALARDLPAWQETVRLPQAQTAETGGGWLVDMGMEVSGYIELRVQSAQPVSLRLTYAEALEQGVVNATKAGMNYADRLEVGPREVAWRSYEKRAFRYLHLDAPVDLRELRVVEQTYPYEFIYRQRASYRERQGSAEGRFINRVLDISARTIELNTEDLLTDCPWRERAQYLDSHFYMHAMQRLFGTLEPVKRFLRQFPRGADSTGLLRMCYPSPAGTTVIPDFSISYTFLLQRYLELSGDLETVKESLPFAVRGIASLRQHEDADGLLTDVPGWIFLDNTFELPKYPRSAGLNAIYHGGHLALAALLRACGDPAAAEEYEARAVALRHAFRQTFLGPDRLLDADSTLEQEKFRQWVYHYSAESGRWSGQSFHLRIRFRRGGAAPLHLSVHEGARAWVDGKLVLTIENGGSWTRSAVFQRTQIPAPADDQWHRLDLEVGWSGIDWECYLSSLDEVEWSPATVWEEDNFSGGEAEPPANAFPTSLRRHVWPWLSQITVGLAAVHGLLEETEARALLQACLPPRYTFPFAKRTTPFFAHIEEVDDDRRILPCNVPASLFYFCHALKRYGMAREARDLLAPICQGMIERGATTWWEEWNTRSSLCHAWTSFVVEFLDVDEDLC